MKKATEEKAYDIICCGAATIDTVFAGVDEHLMETDSSLAEAVHRRTGGDALNTSVSLARLGHETVLCANLGKDDAGESIVSFLKKESIETSWIHFDDTLPTSAPYIFLDKKGERHILRLPGSANHGLREEMVPDELLAKALHLHVGSANVLTALDGEGLGRLFARAHALGLTTSLDASYDKKGRWLANIASAMENCDIFIPSLAEAREYAHSDCPGEIARFFSRWPLSVFGVKLGRDGIYVTDFVNEWQLPSIYKGMPVDTTGAGDAFMGGFLSAYQLGYDIPSCAMAGQAQSASVIASPGANAGAFTKAELSAFLKEKGISLNRR